MRCPNCGASVEENAEGRYVCDYCGSVISPLEPGGSDGRTDDGIDSPEVVVREIHHYHDRPDRLNYALGCLFLFFFPAGLVYYLVNREDFPRRAKAALIVSLAGLALIVLSQALSR